MAKKSKKKAGLPFSFFRSWLLMGTAAIAGAGGWWAWQNTEIKDLVYQYVENGEILTLESKYTPEQIMDRSRFQLIGNEKRTFQEPSYHYSPYLLLEVKYYTDDKKSREGLVLWGMEDGEIILNSESWEKTHGFKDCLECDANRQDFKILYALAKRQGSASVEDLQRDLHIEREALDSWIDSARRKQLIVQKDNRLQLHFENPKLLIFPQTQLKQHLVSKPITNVQRATKKYSRSQMIKMARAAFGDEFTIRQEQEVFLPVYTITVLNADGSLHTTDWNAVTGQQIVPSYLSKAK